MKIIKPIPESEDLIIFIHGFTGGKETWLNSDNSPKQLISFILEDSFLSNKFHYAIFEYDTSIKPNLPRTFRLIRKYLMRGFKGYSLPIKSIAANLKTQIEDRFHKYKRIVIIGHSMGGLIGKQLINDILDKNPRSKIKLFITLATPHLGEGLASIGSVLFKNPQLVDLQLFSKTIHELTDSWIKKEKLPERVYFTAQYDDVVRIGATGLESEFVKTKNTFSNHSSIINPKTNNDDVVISLIKVLNDYFISNNENLTGSKVNTKVFFSRGTPHTDEQDIYINKLKAKLNNYGIELVLSWSPVDPIKQIKTHLNEFYGCLVLALERTYLKEGVEKRGSSKAKNISDQILPTLWIQLEAAMAYQMGIPLLILKEHEVKEEGMFDPNNHSLRVVKINPLDIDGLNDEFMNKSIESWVREVKEYKHKR